MGPVKLAEVVPVFVWTYSESASPAFTFFGGMLQIIDGTGEWIPGNTFSSVLFFTYGKLIFTSTAESNVASLDGSSKYRILTDVL